MGCYVMGSSLSAEVSICVPMYLDEREAHARKQQQQQAIYANKQGKGREFLKFPRR
jgi:hypothetical protein